MTAKVKEALLFAMKHHGDARDDSGDSYFEAHVMKVATAVDILGGKEDVVCAAALHDLIEDTEVTYNDIKEKFGEKVADLVDELTREGKPDDYGYYFPRLRSAEAIMIKLVDRASNVGRMGAWSDSRQKAYLKKTKFWKDGSK